MTRLKKILFAFIFLLGTIKTMAQPSQNSGQLKTNGGETRNVGGLITGQINDSVTHEHIEYATVALFNQSNNEMEGGTITKKNGRFYLGSLKPGDYFLRISFLGYEDKFIRNVSVRPPNMNVSLGKIEIHPSITSLQEVVVDGSTPRIDYKIDKKVINVGKQITAISGTAVDVLENVPSVKVDIEGNVSLRGSSGFQVLIDGRPSILESNEALQQIPASTIDNIEIITNPSAKFDPDGTAGIINIITKKNKLNGISGIVNANIGLYNEYGGDFLVNYKNRNLNIFVGADYNERNFPGESTEERYTFFEDTTFLTLMTGDNDRGRTRWEVRTGMEYNLGSTNLISLSLRYGDRRMEGQTNSNYIESTIPGSLVNRYTNFDETKRGGRFFDLQANYQKKFYKKGHQLIADFSYAGRDTEDNSTNELRDLNGQLVDGKKNFEAGPALRIRGNIDYTLPISKTNKFEAGYQARYSDSEEATSLEFLNLITGDYEEQEEFTVNTTYLRNIHSLYSIYSGELGKFGYQGGIRGEYTFREVVSGGQEFGIDRWDFFPSAHISYKFPKEHQIMASYTRRIERPRGWYLEPFITWQDAFTVRQGNPDLQPEYIDSYEMSYIKEFGDNMMVSMDAYYRITHNKIERVRSVFQENIMLMSIENVGKDYSLGVEFLFSYSPFEWWDLDVMGDFFSYRVEGILYDQDFSNQSNNWSSRLNSTFKINGRSQFQLNSMYNGPSVTAQGRTEGYYMVNAAFRQNFMDDKLSLILQGRDIFATVRREFSSQGPDFRTNSEFIRRAPMLTLSISYKFNNYRTNRKNRGGMGGGDMEDM
jgi:outer membrane receptor protein involved in Fe transport